MKVFSIIVQLLPLVFEWVKKIIEVIKDGQKTTPALTSKFVRVAAKDIAKKHIERHIKNFGKGE